MTRRSDDPYVSGIRGGGSCTALVATLDMGALVHFAATGGAVACARGAPCGCGGVREALAGTRGAPAACAQGRRPEVRKGGRLPRRRMVACSDWERRRPCEVSCAACMHLWTSIMGLAVVQGSAERMHAAAPAGRPHARHALASAGCTGSSWNYAAGAACHPQHSTGTRWEESLGSRSADVESVNPVAACRRRSLPWSPMLKQTWSWPS